jgi:hypothetical protein
MLVSTASESQVLSSGIFNYIFWAQSYNKELVFSDGLRFSARADEPSENEFGDEVKRSKPQK